MKIVSYNINGIRASVKLGLLDWIKDFDADVYCLQEVRCKEELARELLRESKSRVSLFDQNDNGVLSKYLAIFNCGEVAGYAGTLVLSKIKPDKIFYDMGEFWTDTEGRTTTIIINNIAIINTYVPNGNSRLDFKMQYLQALNNYIKHLQKQYKVICLGDFNIAHNEIDLTNPKECKNKSVFLPIEREAFNNLLSLGLIDCFRYLNPNKVEYSWRSYRSRIDSSYNSWKYRIDYILASKELSANFKNCDILDLSYSDHLAVVCNIKD